MLRRPATWLVPLVLLVAGSTGRADTNFTANLTTNQESHTVFLTLSDGTTPRPGASPSGTATFVLNDAGTQLTFTATINNIDVTGSQTADTFDNLIAAHIHAAAPQGTNAGVVWGFFGTPFNDIAPTDTVLTPFATGVGGTFTSKWDAPEGNGTNTLTNRLADIRAGLAYINFHTTQNPMGEIRGQIVPEPASLALLGLGLAGMAGLRWTGRRRRDDA